MWATPKPKKVIIAMGSASDTIDFVVKALNDRGEKVGAIKVRLYRPFSVESLPWMPCLRLSRRLQYSTEPKSPVPSVSPFIWISPPLLPTKTFQCNRRSLWPVFQRVYAQPCESGVFDHMDDKNTHNFTVGINDDVTNLSLQVKEELHVAPKDVVSCMFWGLGSDGTVGANKNSIKDHR